MTEMINISRRTFVFFIETFWRKEYCVRSMNRNKTKIIKKTFRDSKEQKQDLSNLFNLTPVSDLFSNKI